MMYSLNDGMCIHINAWVNRDFVAASMFMNCVSHTRVSRLPCVWKQKQLQLSTIKLLHVERDRPHMLWPTKPGSVPSTIQWKHHVKRIISKSIYLYLALLHFMLLLRQVGENLLDTSVVVVEHTLSITPAKEGGPPRPTYPWSTAECAPSRLWRPVCWRLGRDTGHFCPVRPRTKYWTIFHRDCWE